MANDISDNPWLLDTTGTIVAAGTSISINSLVWENPSTDAHQIIVQDGNGREVWNLTALAGGTGIHYACPARDFVMNGLILDTLDSGKLRVYEG